MSSTIPLEEFYSQRAADLFKGFNLETESSNLLVPQLAKVMIKAQSGRPNLSDEQLEKAKQACPLGGSASMPSFASHGRKNAALLGSPGDGKIAETIKAAKMAAKSLGLNFLQIESTDDIVLPSDFALLIQDTSGLVSVISSSSFDYVVPTSTLQQLSHAGASAIVFQSLFENLPSHTDDERRTFVNDFRSFSEKPGQYIQVTHNFQNVSKVEQLLEDLGDSFHTVNVGPPTPPPVSFASLASRRAAIAISPAQIARNKNSQ